MVCTCFSSLVFQPLKAFLYPFTHIHILMVPTAHQKQTLTLAPQLHSHGKQFSSTKMLWHSTLHNITTSSSKAVKWCCMMWNYHSGKVLPQTKYWIHLYTHILSLNMLADKWPWNMYNLMQFMQDYLHLFIA